MQDSQGIFTAYIELILLGIKEYRYLNEVGTFKATLRFRSWGRRLSIRCHFETDEGHKFYLYAWPRAGRGFCPLDSLIDFTTVHDGTCWIIETRINSKGNTVWSTAIQFETEDN